ncbi:Expansin-like A3 [Bienertia sinuspersici]
MSALLIYSMFCLFLFATACDQFVQSKTVVFSSASALSSGACGYDSLALKLSGGNEAAGVPSVYRDEAGHGACFQIRCKNSAICNKKGQNRAFQSHGLPGKDLHVLMLGIVDVE